MGRNSRSWWPFRAFHPDQIHRNATVRLFRTHPPHSGASSHLPDIKVYYQYCQCSSALSDMISEPAAMHRQTVSIVRMPSTKFGGISGDACGLVSPRSEMNVKRASTSTNFEKSRWKPSLEVLRLRVESHFLQKGKKEPFSNVNQVANKGSEYSGR